MTKEAEEILCLIEELDATNDARKAARLQKKIDEKMKKLPIDGRSTVASEGRGE